MSGIYNGVQKKKIIAIKPNVVYVRCAVHNLNLVINDVAKQVTKMVFALVRVLTVRTFYLI